MQMTRTEKLGPNQAWDTKKNVKRKNETFKSRLRSLYFFLLLMEREIKWYLEKIACFILKMQLVNLDVHSIRAESHSRHAFSISLLMKFRLPSAARWETTAATWDQFPVQIRKNNVAHLIRITFYSLTGRCPEDMLSTFFFSYCIIIFNVRCVKQIHAETTWVFKLIHNDDVSFRF